VLRSVFARLVLLEFLEIDYNFWSSHCLIVASGCAPTNSSTIFPSLKSFTEGIDIRALFRKKTPGRKTWLAILSNYIF